MLQCTLDLLEQGFRLSRSNYNGLSNSDRRRLEAIVNNSYAYYFTKRNKFSAALQHVLRAKKINKYVRDWTNLAISEIHFAYVLSRLNRTNDVLKSLNRVILLANNGMLSIDTERKYSGEHVLILAVAYHNIAVQNVKCEKIREACVSSQHGRRLIKLCLNYGNAFVNNFETTHRTCLDRLMKIVNNRGTISKSQHTGIDDLFKQIVTDLFE